MQRSSWISSVLVLLSYSILVMSHYILGSSTTQVLTVPFISMGLNKENAIVLALINLVCFYLKCKTCSRLVNINFLHEYRYTSIFFFHIYITKKELYFIISILKGSYIEGLTIFLMKYTNHVFKFIWKLLKYLEKVCKIANSFHYSASDSNLTQDSYIKI